MARKLYACQKLVARCISTIGLANLTFPIFGGPVAQDFAVELTASVSEEPAQIVLAWRPDLHAVTYKIARKLLSEDNWTPIAVVAGAASTFVDQAIQVGVAYEYQVIKTTSLGYPGYGYICAGIRRNAVDPSGKIILFVEQSLAHALDSELQQLQQDLVGDGWLVLRHDVAATDPVTSIKEIIRADYQSDPANVKSLFLFGHIPVPYSGDIAPDGHPSHHGAWPADVYYGEFDGVWTDTYVNATGAADKVNWNVPGDGKFDQSIPPGPVSLEIGRVDLSNMTCFANKIPSRSEIDLARGYLEKDHYFRHALLNVQRRGLIYDNRGTNEEDPLAETAWRNFPGFFGSDHISEIQANQFFSILKDQSYLWSYTCSGGNVTGSDYVGLSDDFALNDPQVVFTSFLGSYFGDWNRESDFLRAPLGDGSYTLTCIYGGQPQWILHPMGLGETIGYAANLTQNNSSNGIYAPHKNFGVGQVHIALMGDPTLRLHPVKPPANLTGAEDAGGLNLTWSASKDSDIVGYRIYRSASSLGPYTRISGRSLQLDTTFRDPLGSADFNYMVRAVKLEHSPGGTYYNLSQGAFFLQSNGGSLAGGAPSPPARVLAKAVSANAITLSWFPPSSEVASFEIERRQLPDGVFGEIANPGSDVLEFTDHSVQPGVYSYRMKASNSHGDSAYSPETTINLLLGSATFVKTDSITQGSWPGTYGQDGYVIVSGSTNLPSYLQLTEFNAYEFVFQRRTNDVSGLVLPDDQGRIVACWFGSYLAPITVSLHFSDQVVHRVAIYFFDDHDDRRTSQVEVSEPLTGEVLDSESLTNYGNGKYLVFDISGAASIRIIPGAYGNAILNGIFFSTPPVDTPVFTPPGGLFPGETAVNMSSIPGATIRYTTNGAIPDENSTVYQAPIELTSNASIMARAFKDGYTAPSPVASAFFTNWLITEARFFSTDRSTLGDWPGKYGQEAFWVLGGDSRGSRRIALNPVPHGAYVWSDSSIEGRALRRSPNDSARLAARWDAADELSIDLNIYDQNPQASHKVIKRSQFARFIEQNHGGLEIDFRNFFGAVSLSVKSDGCAVPPFSQNPTK